VHPAIAELAKATIAANVKQTVNAARNPVMALTAEGDPATFRCAYNLIGTLS
jgi:hypothetical protein